MIQYKFDYYYNYHYLLFYRHIDKARIGHICRYNNSFINYHYIITSNIMLVLWMIYKYMANRLVWKIILSIYDYEWGLGYNIYNDVTLVPEILPVKVICLSRLIWRIAKIILELSAEKAKASPGSDR
jgi:hypothetical protein